MIGVGRARCWVLRGRTWEGFSFFMAGSSWARFLLPVGAGGGGGFRPYFENYTVDASIFESSFGVVLIDDLKDH